MEENTQGETSVLRVLKGTLEWIGIVLIVAFTILLSLFVGSVMVGGVSALSS